VFDAVEDVENNRIIKVISWIKELLRNMSHVQTLDDLVNSFKVQDFILFTAGLYEMRL